MTSTDIDGTPILILRLPDVKHLLKMVDKPMTGDEDWVMGKIMKFLNDPICINWEQQRDTDG